MPSALHFHAGLRGFNVLRRARVRCHRLQQGEGEGFGDEGDRAARQVVFRGLDEPAHHGWLLAQGAEVRTWISRATQETRDSIQERFQRAFLAAARAAFPNDAALKATKP